MIVPEEAYVLRVRRGVIVAIAAALLIAAWLARSSPAIGQQIGPACDVGATGTAAVVSVQGWTSGDLCSTWQDEPGGAYYRYQAPTPAEPIVCQFEIDGALVTVRDQGAFKLTGGAICQALGLRRGAGRGH